MHPCFPLITTPCREPPCNFPSLCYCRRVRRPSLPPSPAPSISRIRRPRNTSAAALAPPPPPPVNSLPPAPGATQESAPPEPPSSSRHLEVGRQRGEPPPGHKRTNSGSRLAALEEEGLDSPQSDRFSRHLAPDARIAKGDSPPLPPLPSPTTARFPTSAPKAPPSPRMPVAMPNIITPRPRGSSYVPTSRPEVPQLGVINGTTMQGTIFQRRTRGSAPPSSRSSSPTGSTTSVGSVPKSATFVSSWELQFLQRRHHWPESLRLTAWQSTLARQWPDIPHRSATTVAVVGWWQRRDGSCAQIAISVQAQSKQPAHGADRSPAAIELAGPASAHVRQSAHHANLPSAAHGTHRPATEAVPHDGAPTEYHDVAHGRVCDTAAARPARGVVTRAARS
ncbi:hypothetical protein C8J57DRAFT_22489 [Mycena rebaudengoi]|nr:hypothetical protein C8J57DRAFT_22489 [Mycena rebaudengoi]